ncbi:PhzF family phenazine biosynthesis protein [Paenibacillus aceris]|uniref:PhzF family phenazine biosynthesis protein n=1 Tax=Paenibacillus aceris TaxID=869555 RepID=A0ABS4I8F1_9BACL|nr:PhzF family phenazine biosynthesis protein [Paenibacillus aceris]MBP1967183.1 PhzF family phenazine biosynthesis protein [Paenibacillus aceris]NHW35579.1 PhzF family phenazine biosynthesis protein [Paenibacillus aceris]
MKQIRIYHIDSFTQNPFEGNPAGVIPEASGLTVTQMQKIANELNLPESAFLLPPTDPKADFRVRYFTPLEEINFCGHATVGSAWLLANEYGWAEKADQIVFETKVGLIPVHWDKNENKISKVTMTQVSPKVKQVPFDKSEIARLVGIVPDQLDDRYPIKLAYTGNWHLVVPVKTHQAIDTAIPKLDQLSLFNKKYNISTTHLFTFDAKPGFNLYTRDFAPAIGIPEDPVTGAANGALAGYLVLEGIVSNKETHRLTIGQGDAVGRPGTLFVTIIPTELDTIIKVGGFAHVTIEGMLRLPE